MSANFAYRTLIYQGFAKDDIFYLTSDTDLDFDGDGIPDVNGDATNANLQSAITGWAVNENADSLVLYLVDHGGEDTFRMSGSETLSSENLANWLNQLQANISGRIVVIYDACKSGSFIDDLRGDNRIIITSTLPSERAKFLSQGTISFSNFFWTHIFNSMSIEEAFLNAKQVVNFAFENQNPMLSGAAENVYIGSGEGRMIGEAPDIGSVSQPQDIDDETSADLYADGVDDPDGVARVWATVWPPGTNLGSTEIPLLDQLPTFELVHIGGNSYKGTYGGFTQDGAYQIAIYAMDGNNNTSIPKLTSVSHNYHLTRKAIIVAGGESVITTRSIIETNAGLAYNALLSQLYTDDDIYFMSVTGIPGFDVAPSNSNLENHLNSLAGDGDIENLDLTIYMIGAGNTGIFTMNDDPVPDILNASSQLDVWLDNLQSSKSCRVTLIYDADKSGSFIPVLYLPNPPQGKERILITSSSDNGAAYFSSEGDISFSSFFWSQVAVGAILYDAFAHAKKAISYFSHKKEISFSCYKQQGPLLEADGDDAGNEESDYQVARTCTIGIGIKFADDPPQIGSVSVDEEGSVLTISAEDITWTKEIQRVWAIIKHIRYCPENSNEEEAEIVEVDLLDPDEDGSYEYTDIVPFNCYQINVYAMDIDNNKSLPKETRIYQTEGQDIYEVDNTYLQANVIVINHLIPQPHNFHYSDDKDWIKFYGHEGEYYTIEAGNLGTDCEPVIELYAPIPIVEDTILNDKVTIDFECLEDGIYYVRLLSKTGAYGEDTGYDLRVDNASAGDLPALITGSVMNQLSWQGIDGALITISGGDSYFSVGGKYDLYHKPGGGLTITATAVGYADFTDTISIEAEDQIIVKDIMMTPIKTSECRTNASCSDGQYCNGMEMCIGGTCSPGISLPCPDDELFCNGEESCDEENDICLSSGNPCPANLTCDE
ncbi:MAG: caspase family protein, partial [Deltaproteobacteria bacterium]|nr:caspase family protein [Deltaproteobacteria bacterium]